MRASKEDENLYNILKCQANYDNEVLLAANQEGTGESFPVHRCEIRREEPLYTFVDVDGVSTKFEIDTGASLTVIGEDEYLRYFGGSKLLPTQVKLKTFSGECIRPVGMLEVSVQESGETQKLPLIVTPGNTPNLLGRNWLKQVKLNWAEMFDVKKVDDVPIGLDKLLEKHSVVFEKGLGTFKDVKVKIELQEGAQPKYMKARPVPYAIGGV